MPNSVDLGLKLFHKQLYITQNEDGLSFRFDIYHNKWYLFTDRWEFWYQ